MATCTDSEWIDVTVASLDDPKTYHPAVAIWTEDKLPWVKLDRSRRAFRRSIAYLDIDKPSVASRFPNHRHEDFTGSVTDLPFASEEFDACICTEVMEHIEEDDKGFAKLARVLKPGGLLLISPPTPAAPFDPNHVREGYTYEDMREHLERRGFDLLKHTYCFHWMM